MMSALARLLGLREDEGPGALKAFAVLFHMIAGHTMLETARDALFLAKMPPSRLAVMYLILAAITLVTSTQMSRLSQRFGPRNALIATLTIGAWAATFLRFQAQSSWRVMALYIFTGVLAGMLVAQFWLVIGRMFTVSQGRRVFGPIAAGGVLGAAFGSSAAAGLLMVLRVESLLLFAAGAFVVASVLLTRLPRSSDEPAAVAEKKDIRQSLGLRPKAVERAPMADAERKYLRRLGLYVVLGTAASLIADYIFKSTAAASVDKAHLGAFFARSYALLNIAALIIQLFVASRLLARLGVAGAIALMPLLMLLACGGSVIVGLGLASALLIRGVDGSLKHSVNRVSTELLYLPLTPLLRERAHLLIDSVIARIAQAGAAALVLLFVTGEAMTGLPLASPRGLTFALGAIAALWLVSAGLVRRPYIDLFREALSRGRLDQDPHVKLDLASVERVIEALSDRDGARAVAALQLLEHKGRAKLVPSLILYHESEMVLREALPILAHSGGSQAWVPLAERLLNHSDLGVRLAALRALASVKKVEALARLAEDTAPENADLRVHAIYALVSGEASRPIDDPRVSSILRGTDDEQRRALLQAIAAGEDDRWGDVVLAMLSDRSPDTLPTDVVLAMAQIADPRLLPAYIACLGTREGRAIVREALVRLGEPALTALELALAAPDTDRHVRLHIPRTISKFHTARAANDLVRIIEDSSDGHLRYKALRGLGRMVTGYDVPVDRARILALLRKNLEEHSRMLGISFPIRARLLASPPLREEANASLRLVLDLVETKVEQALERAFRLLQIAHPRERIDRTYQALRSTDRRIRASAVEFLDALTLRRGEEDIRELLRRAIDDPTHAVLADAALEGVEVPVSYEDAITRLLEDGDETLALLAAHHASLVGPSMAAAMNRTLQARPALAQESKRLFGAFSGATDFLAEPQGA